MTLTSLQQSIIETIAYFDVANFPLTQEEVWSYLWKPPTVELMAVVAEIERMVEKGILETKYGFYFFSGRAETVERRRQAALCGEFKLKKARRAVWLIKSIPFLKTIFVCNSVAAETAADDSDIDFFIIARRGRVWWVRFISNIILFLAGMRRHGDFVADRICLSFYVDEDNLDLTPLALGSDDVHFVYWMSQFLPLYDPEKYVLQFKERNTLITNCLPHKKTTTGSRVFLGPMSRLGRWWKFEKERWLGGSVGDKIETYLRELQRTKMKFSSRGKVRSTDKGVVATTGVIKLHEEDTRAAYKEKWLQRVEEIKRKWI